MPAPVMSFYESDSTHDEGTVIDVDEPIFGGGEGISAPFEKGVIGPIFTMHLWNDKGGGASSDVAVAPKISAVNGVTNMSIIFNGTDINGHVSMLEARSCGALGVAADQQQDWTPIGPTQTLTVGDIPSDCMRVIELRMNVPQDSADLATAAYILRCNV